MYSEILRLYESAFPVEERRYYASESDFERFVAEKDGKFEVHRIADAAGNFQGFITLWHFPGFDYVEHFAVDPDMRGRGIGAEVIRSLADSGRAVILEVEDPEIYSQSGGKDDAEMARRRIGFYERAGFRLEEYPYVQPPYREGLPEVPMRLMTSNWPEELPLSEAVAQIRRDVYNR